MRAPIGHELSGLESVGGSGEVLGWGVLWVLPGGAVEGFCVQMLWLSRFRLARMQTKQGSR